MAPETTSTAEHLRNALDGRWRDVRNRMRETLSEDLFRPHYTPNTVIARTKVAEQMRIMAAFGAAADGFRKEHGGTGDVGAAITMIEMLAMSDLSLMVKAGVQWGLFGGAVENLGTERHHETYVPKIISLELRGCFAMTETGHGSDVQSLETTATYDPATEEFVIDSPTPSARKDYIGGAAETATVAAVFAQLITTEDGKPVNHGVHCLLVPIRDADGNDLPGVTTSDCEYKGGLPGVDNGRIVFDHVRVPRVNLLNKYGDVAPDGTYSSPIENPNRRFFTMLGTLVRGRITVGGSAGAAGRVALDIATRYALQRKQFTTPDGDSEVLIMDYLVHQRRLFPLIAKSYALQFAQNELVSKCHDIQSADDPDADEQRELEARAAGLKAANTWHATRAIQESREACGGAGYMAENRLIALRGDTDVFTTFEGDNHVLTQLVAKELLTAYADDIKSMSPVEWVRFAANAVGDRVIKRTAAETIIQTIVDARQDSEEEGSLFNRGTQIKMFEDREEYLLASVARRLQAKSKEMSEFDAFNSVQDHVLHAASAHIDRVVLEAFVAGIDGCPDEQARELLGILCDLYALSVIEDDKAWYIEHRYLSTERAKAVTRGINDRCRALRPHAQTLVDGFGIPERLRYAEMLHPENLSEALTS
ncbi:acyl-CoA dehydrogenase family protein [Mycobacterium avium subsp. hominissuis]|jgi:acyl-CoA oxidase|uniref:acyl-CoA oxidase n=8 Tax=Mycobacterium avium complex (MAC) TaxID=120793 RepID=A0A2A3LAR4_MYCAV|nr:MULTISPECIES: acyl-CoA dehydrogenase [Mycobacterium avium complex (MAC)]ETA92948.1 acyl-CoA oxidase [Mycobacterium avium 05-4293]ETB14128.1 acyl-CoA oxidase [Mycobacterium avium subsp. silvaticum ATCC 49884]ETB21838.1 acyl-CoA oxidase [Mycobacterium avium subsp. avium 11-4751]ETB26018.1 acyl-CoA oxidase [Mycobacterium avium 09-5983]ETB42229.1 acyl-CoA oxidase [Mycobacterium avium subsp. hominissuis 10-5606]TXA43164.1 acyl-CoA oxidase [Mycobacterium tuberculosis variant bovis]